MIYISLIFYYWWQTLFTLRVTLLLSSSNDASVNIADDKGSFDFSWIHINFARPHYPCKRNWSSIFASGTTAAVLKTCWNSMHLGGFQTSFCLKQNDQFCLIPLFKQFTGKTNLSVSADIIIVTMLWFFFSFLLQKHILFFFFCTWFKISFNNQSEKQYLLNSWKVTFAIYF